MNDDHVSDNDIQQFVLQKDTLEDRVAKHMQLCEDCKRKAQLYAVLFEGVHSQPKPAFDFCLQDVVMTQLLQSKSEDRLDKLLVSSIMAISIILIGSNLYFFRNELIGAIYSITPILAYLVGITGVCMLLFLVLDLYGDFRMKVRMLDYN
ncbi:hypothetical protein [Salmonirosea aquatica]|uniref:Zinc-finger domain-containing protein n=1 Tax=Salmonirosea aquatica TaxID=2654236 RepID=A0A7C9F4S3_9BACT|nr:hypothetical protein [Cytophagaceae bacterium SJW1-29]